VVVVRSPRHANQPVAGLETRLRHAATPLAALTPSRGRGKRHLTAAATRWEAMALVRTAQRVAGWLSVTGDQQVEQKTQDGGRGRGAVSRETRVSQTTRAHRTPLTRQHDNLTALRQRFGWQACGTKAGHKRWSWPQAVWCSRHAYRVARLCNRLKSRVPLAPLCVKLHEHLAGLTSLLTRGVRG
jgi:hypothetical protein